MVVSDGELRLPHRTVALRTRALGDMPVVTGVFSDLNLGVADAPRVIIQTRVYSTSQTLRQVMAGVLAVLSAFITVLLLVLPSSSRRQLVTARLSFRAVWGRCDRTDFLVVGTLLVWWLVAPTLADDGYVWVSHRAFADVGAMNWYFDVWGVNWPTGYWLDWLRHWPDSSTTELALVRLPTLACLLLTWFLCRSSLRQATGGRAARGVRWTLAGAFSVAAVAWGMTLRPEPFISLLTLVALAGMLAFARSPRFSVLAVALVASIFGASAHPAGVVAVAPIVAGSPAVLGWVRRGWRPRIVGLGALLISSGAVALVVFTLNADLTQRFAETRVVRTDTPHSEPWWREYVRYTNFDRNFGATPTRNLALLLLALTVIALITRKRPARTGVSLLPARSVAVGLVLLASVPSKWPWHFCAFLGIGAVAAAAEVERLVREPGRPTLVRQAWMLVSLALIALWPLTVLGNWGAFELQRLRWNEGLGVGGLLALAVAASTALLVPRWRKSIARQVRAPSSAVAWPVPAAAAAFVALTVGLLVIDAAVSAWTPARQNVDTLAGRRSCGLADQLHGNLRDIQRLSDGRTPVLLTPLIAPFFPCSRTPAIDHGVVETPRLVSSESRTPWPLVVPAGPFAAIPDLYPLKVAARGPRGLTVLSVSQHIPGFRRAGAVRVR